MKHSFIYLLLIAGFISAMPGCKKQIAKETDIIINDSTPVDEPIYPEPLAISTGLLVGKIMPETKFSMTLYNDQLTYSDFSIMNRAGAFIMKNIKAGEYTLLIEPFDPDASPLELTRIKVDSGRTTNLGLIFMP